MGKVTIDEKEYETDEMSDEAKQQLISLQWVTNEIQSKNLSLAALQTARIAYGRALKEALGEGEGGEEEIIIVDDEITFD